MVPNKYQRRLRSQTPDLWTDAETAVKQSEEGERERERKERERWSQRSEERRSNCANR